MEEVEREISHLIQVPSPSHLDDEVELLMKLHYQWRSQGELAYKRAWPRQIM